MVGIHFRSLPVVVQGRRTWSQGFKNQGRQADLYRWKMRRKPLRMLYAIILSERNLRPATRRIEAELEKKGSNIVLFLAVPVVASRKGLTRQRPAGIFPQREGVKA
jgi:hypothetical protein